MVCRLNLCLIGLIILLVIEKIDIVLNLRHICYLRALDSQNLQKATHFVNTYKMSKGKTQPWLADMDYRVIRPSRRLFSRAALSEYFQY